LNQLEELKSILQMELHHLKTNLLKYHSQEDDATGRLLSRLADRNDIIRINTIEWVLKIITKLEKQQTL
jgi:hypothetical protein